jgi:hypothetical protein
MLCSWPEHNTQPEQIKNMIQRFTIHLCAGPAAALLQAAAAG